jgi:hypothetical protein
MPLSGILNGESKRNTTGDAGRPTRLWPHLAAQSDASVLCARLSEVLKPALQASSRRFSPTRLATTLTSSLPPLPTATGAGDAKDQGFIVLETNYRLYAYTGTRYQLLRRRKA